MTTQADVLIAGAGPAGIAAALRAHEAGASVTLLDDNAAPGGQIWRGGVEPVIDSEARPWLNGLRAASIPVMGSTRILSGDPAAKTVLVETPEGAREIRYGRLILATGARELFLPFPGWTQPGVAGVGGLQALVKGGLDLSGKRVVIGGSGPLLLAVAAYLHKHGARVLVIAEQAPASALASFAAHSVTMPGKLRQAAALRVSLSSVPYRSGCWVEAAEGGGRVERVRLRAGDRRWTESCDYAAIAYGLHPNTELAALLGCRVDPQGVAVDDMQQSSVAGILCAGECTGIGGVELSIAEGEIAGYAAAGKPDRAKKLFPPRERARRFAARMKTAFSLRPELLRLAAPDTIVCRCEDVTLGQLQPYSSFRAAKLHTRCGMGTCQGRICGAAAQVLFGWRDRSIRPPVFPAAVASLALEPTPQQEAQSGK